MPKIALNDIELYYEIHGTGKQLLLIAGFSCDCLFWTPILNALSQHFQVIIFDNRGVGRSSAPDIPYTIELMAQDTFALTQALQLRTPHILGHSMGGAIAQTLIHNHPHHFDKLILCNTFCKLSLNARLLENNILKMHQNKVPLSIIVDAIIPWIYSSSFLNKKGNLKFLQDLLLNPPYPQSLVGFKRQLEALIHFDSSSWITNILSPTLIISGGEDFICIKDFLELHKKIKNSKLFQFPMSGHISFVEETQHFIEQILLYLKNN